MMSESVEESLSAVGSQQDVRCIGLHPDDPNSRCPERATWEVMTACDYGHEKSGPACALHKYELEQGMADDKFDHPVKLLYATPL
jgi:hypothetical protein